MIKLRGHHIFCLLGYRGMGYSEEYAANMTKIHDMLREKPDTMIQVMKGPDHLCAKFPDGQPYHCEDDGIYVRDSTILSKLGLKVSDVLPWREVERRIRLNVVPEDITAICETCSWRSYGFCQQGVDDMIGLKGLRKVTNDN